MRVPKTFTMIRKYKQTKLKPKPREKRGKQQEEGEISGKCILNS